MIDIAAWIVDRIAGLYDFEYHELAVPTINRDEAVAAWIIRCLANPKCEGSADVLNSIVDRREKVQP